MKQSNYKIMEARERKQLEINAIKEDIKKIIKDDGNSTLSFDDEEDDFMLFATRENGDVGEEMSSQIDYNDAHNIRTKLMAKYAGKIVVDIEDIDEWVNLRIEFV